MGLYRDGIELLDFFLFLGVIGEGGVRWGFVGVEGLRFGGLGWEVWGLTV